MAISKKVQYIEIDVDYCSLTYSVAPCQASLVNSPPTGTIKCFNTLATCQDRANFTNAPVTLRFAVPTNYLSQSIESIPSIKSIQFDPAQISLGKDLGQRATLTISFNDHRHSDTGAGFDKYLTDRNYNPYTQGTFWGKFAARQPFVRGRPLRWIVGNSDQSLGEMETRNFIIDSFSGPTNNGEFKLIAKDLLKLADGDRALAPTVSNGYLVSDITNSAATLTLSPTDIGDSEYPLSGYAAIGGSEIVKFTRDAYTVLLLNFEGSDASTVFLDEAKFKTVTPAGNAQIDTAQFKFGVSSALFDTSGDYLTTDGSADFAFGTGDFTIEMFIRLANTGIQRFITDFRPNGVNGLYPTLFIVAGNTLQYFVNSATRITGATALTTGQWYHVALARSGTSTKLFLNGTQEGSTYTDSNNYIVGASRPIIGAAMDLTQSLNGWIDNLRIRKGIAVYTANFTAPTSPVGLTALGDVLSINRGQLGTTASSHSAQDRAQLCLIYDGVSPDIIIADLLETYAGVDAANIPAADWAAEIDAYLNRVYTATIAQPTAVNNLISELIEQAGLSMWWDDRNEHINMLVLRGLNYTNYFFDENNVMADTLEVVGQPDKRLSQVHTYFGQINPLTSLTDKANYRSVSKAIDAQTEADYGSAMIKEIFSRWIPAGGRSVADRLGSIMVARFKDPPRKITYSLLRDSTISEIMLGNGYQIEAWPLQDETGAEETVNIQITRLRPDADIIQVEAEEVLYPVTAAEDLINRHIIIDANTHDINLREIHDLIYPEPESGVTNVIVTINSGVKVGATSAGIRSFDVGSWPASINIIINVVGRIQGRGGNGGSVSADAQTGGTALYTRYAIKLAVSGQLYGGGGGGGWGTSGVGVSWGGSGGAGFDPGTGGAGGGGANGNSGTTEAGGASNGVGGAGGGPGAAGSFGAATPANGPIGAAGVAIDGVSLVTTGSWDGTTFTPGALTGTVLGGQIN